MSQRSRPPLGKSSALRQRLFGFHSRSLSASGLLLGGSDVVGTRGASPNSWRDRGLGKRCRHDTGNSTHEEPRIRSASSRHQGTKFVTRSGKMRRPRNTIDLEGQTHMAPLGPRTTRKAKQVILGASVATVTGNIARLRGTKVGSDRQPKDTRKKKHIK